jgi:hypothetical protein
MPKLTLNHTSGDCGNSIAVNTFDEYTVYKDEEPVATVRAVYDGDAIFYGVKGSCANLPGIFNDYHLIACVTMTVIRAFNEDCEFYQDAFYDAYGDSIALPLQILALS